MLIAKIAILTYDNHAWLLIPELLSFVWETRVARHIHNRWELSKEASGSIFIGFGMRQDWTQDLPLITCEYPRLLLGQYSYIH